MPVLKHGGIVIWETLAIIEYLAELYPEAGLWPGDPAARAHARAISTEMHAGFAPLRNHMPMDLQNEFPGEGKGEGVARNIKRIREIWQGTRDRFGAGGDFLCGGFSAADIMFAPVVTRFRTYGVELDPMAQAYADAILDQPLMREWTAAALSEPPPGEVPT